MERKETAPTQREDRRCCRGASGGPRGRPLGDSTDSLVSSSISCGASTPPLPPAVPRPPQARPAWTLPQSAAMYLTSVGFPVPGSIHISFCTICAPFQQQSPTATLIWRPGQSLAVVRQPWLVKTLCIPTASDRSAVARMLGGVVQTRHKDGEQLCLGVPQLHHALFC